MSYADYIAAVLACLTSHYGDARAADLVAQFLDYITSGWELSTPAAQLCDAIVSSVVRKWDALDFMTQSIRIHAINGQPAVLGIEALGYGYVEASAIVSASGGTP